MRYRFLSSAFSAYDGSSVETALFSLIICSSITFCLLTYDFLQQALPIEV